MLYCQLNNLKTEENNLVKKSIDLGSILNNQTFLDVTLENMFKKFGIEEIEFINRGETQENISNYYKGFLNNTNWKF